MVRRRSTVRFRKGLSFLQLILSFSNLSSILANRRGTIRGPARRIIPGDAGLAGYAELTDVPVTRRARVQGVAAPGDMSMFVLDVRAGGLVGRDGGRRSCLGR